MQRPLGGVNSAAAAVHATCEIQAFTLADARLACALPRRCTRSKRARRAMLRLLLLCRQLCASSAGCCAVPCGRGEDCVHEHAVFESVLCKMGRGRARAARISKMHAEKRAAREYERAGPANFADRACLDVSASASGCSRAQAPGAALGAGTLRDSTLFCIRRETVALRL